MADSDRVLDRLLARSKYEVMQKDLERKKEQNEELERRTMHDFLFFCW